MMYFGSKYLDLDTILYVFNLRVNKEGKINQVAANDEILV